MRSTKLSVLGPYCSECARVHAHLQAWITDMSAYLKTLDSKHLVTVGEEGYWATYDPMSMYNPAMGGHPSPARTSQHSTGPKPLILPPSTSGQTFG